MLMLNEILRYYLGDRYIW